MVGWLVGIHSATLQEVVARAMANANSGRKSHRGPIDRSRFMAIILVAEPQGRGGASRDLDN
jgi:hypothetical protein